MWAYTLTPPTINYLKNPTRQTISWKKMGKYLNTNLILDLFLKGVQGSMGVYLIVL
jgi:hypothetical protein